jgi:hypothetical protein
MRKSKRILVGPWEVAGYYRNLCEGFRQLGVPYDFITYKSHAFGYGGETRQPTLLRIARWFSRIHNKSGRSRVARLFGALPFEILTSVWALWAICRYDVFIFGFGLTLLRGNWDLPILRMLGKTVITNLSHGSEARPPFIDGFYQAREAETVSAATLYNLTKRNKRCVAMHEKYVDIVIGAPFATAQFASRRLINTFAIGLPFQPLQAFDSASSRPQVGANDLRAVRILHSPSNPVAKGSSQIIRAIERLKARGHAIDFVLIQGRPFREVLEAIQFCDFVVDQLYCDTPMAGFAVESAWFGKPAVVGGYGLDRLRSYVPDGMWPPSKICHPDRIEQAIEDLILDSGERQRLGREAQAFVQGQLNATKVAARYLRLIEGDIPEAWWLNPETIVYLEGGGQAETRTREMIRVLVEAYGVKALKLEHRLDLRNAFLEFANIQTPH